MDRAELETRKALARVTERGAQILMGCYRGSTVHGTHDPSADGGVDDEDLAAVFSMPLRYYTGMPSWHGARRSARQETVDTGGPGNLYDVAAHELRKFVALLRSGNPSVHLWLWVPERFRFITTPAADYLISVRREFLSQRNLDATAGYARQQMEKMVSGQHKGFMGARRKALVDEHGYDLKNAAHCVRLLHQGIHLLETGDLLIWLEGQPRDAVRAVKFGQLDLAEVKALTSRLWKRFREAEERNRSQFPKRISRERADRFLHQAHIMAGTYDEAVS